MGKLDDVVGSDRQAGRQEIRQPQQQPPTAFRTKTPALTEAKLAELNLCLLGAAGCGNLGLAKQMIEDGANPRSRDENGVTVLMKAAMNGHFDVVKWLVEDCHVPLDEKDNEGMTALMHAAQKSQRDVTQYLVNKGSNPNELDNFLRNALIHACLGSNNRDPDYDIEVVGILLPGTHDINHVDAHGATALDWAEFSRKEDVADLLRRWGALEKDARIHQDESQ